MKLTAIPAFSDNYIWMVDDGRHAVVVDPGEAAPVLLALNERNLRLVGILVTHHHRDHVGGVEHLRSILDGPVWGPAGESTPEPRLAVVGDDNFKVLGLRWQVLDVPGHTRGHVAYFVPHGTGHPLLFCGDTLFSGGCGRLFEGTAEQMHGSLQALARLPAQTRVCCAHEYTLANLRFARAVEPTNQNLVEHARWCEEQRAAGLPTLPSTLEIELRLNPFLRCHEPQVASAARARGVDASDAVSVFAALRAWKDAFR
jgi:hydroxyacylglutathione hydrolase